MFSYSDDAQESKILRETFNLKSLFKSGVPNIIQIKNFFRGSNPKKNVLRGSVFLFQKTHLEPVNIITLLKI